METYETLMARRSIRKYTTTPIDDKILERVLEAARISAKNRCAVKMSEVT